MPNNNHEYFQRVKTKLFEAVDPTNEYTMSDFEKEFTSVISIDPATKYKIDLKFENRSSNPNPVYATAGSSGFDLRANLKEKIYLKPREHRVIPTGLYFDIPENYEIQVRSRSGLAHKWGIAVLNSPGTVDSDYRGECGVILINHGNVDFEIKHGDRIAQAVLVPVLTSNVVELNQVDKISENASRGVKGFGSTGIQ